jgi:flagellum-specific ATP synthase
MFPLDREALNKGIRRVPLFRRGGMLRSSNGMLTCSMPAAVGDQCHILCPGREPLLAEVIGFSDRTAYLMPFDSAELMRSGLPAIRLGQNANIPVGPGTLGRVMDGLGRPVDGKGPLRNCEPWPIHQPAPQALERTRIRKPFVTGQKVIDSLLTCGRGQRIGIFSGSGIGKSTLLGEIANGAESDVNVIGLIGERGREVGPFIEDCLGPKGLARSVVVVATSEQSPLMRVRASQATIALADYHRQRGANVLLMMDSLTRLAMAQREIGLRLGEPPSSRGYTPSVFQMLATSIERLGNSDKGEMTAILTVLVDGDDMEEPISDAVRSMVDGHIVLDRHIAERGMYPAVDVARSISRVAIDVIDAEHGAAARKLRAILATYADVRDLIRIGAYARGSSQQVDRACDLMPAIEKFLRQPIGERIAFDQTRRELIQIVAQWPW